MRKIEGTGKRISCAEDRKNKGKNKTTSFFAPESASTAPSTTSVNGTPPTTSSDNLVPPPIPMKKEAEGYLGANLPPSPISIYYKVDNNPDFNLPPSASPDIKLDYKIDANLPSRKRYRGWNPRNHQVMRRSRRSTKPPAKLME